MNKREVGSEYEEAAVQYLKKQGLTVLERNFRCRMGEIDIIAQDHKYLVFIEVKYRRNSRYGGALPAVNLQKQKTISKVALFYLMSRGFSESTPCRFDVVGITGDQIHFIKNAFAFRR